MSTTAVEENAHPTAEAAGIEFVPFKRELKNMAAPGLSFLKTFVKSSLDNYVLPGTLTGTEILLLYMSHWKRNLHVFILGALHLIMAELTVGDAEENPTGTQALSECTVDCAENSKTA